MGIKVELNADEVLQGALVGTKRNINAVFRGARGHNRQPFGALWQNHIEGALAEMAVAKASGKFWSTGDKGELDIGNWEIRYTANPAGDLVIRKSDEQKKKHDKAFILVRGGYGSYEVVGWYRGIDGMVDEYWGDPTGGKRDKAWFVPWKILHKFKSQQET